MSLRLRWTLALSAAALLLLGAAGWFAQRTSVQLERESQQEWASKRTEQLHMQLQRWSALTAASVEDLTASSSVDVVLEAALGRGEEGRREIAQWAPRQASLRGLGLLILLTGDGRILSQVPGPEAHGLKHPFFATFDKSPDGVLVWQGWIAPSSGQRPWWVGVVRRFEFQGAGVLLVGARELSARSLSDMTERAGLTRLEMGLEIGGLQAAPLPADWTVEGELPLVFDPGTSPASGILSALRSRLARLLLASVIVVLLMAPFLAGGLAHPLLELTGAVRRMRTGERKLRLKMTGPKELRELAMAIEELSRELDASEARAEAAQRRAAWREMARRVAHELKNALSPLTLALDNVETAASRLVQTASEDANPQEQENLRTVLRSSLQTAREQLASLDRLVREFRDFASTPGLQLKTVDALGLCRAALSSMREGFPQLRFAIVEASDVGEIEADTEQLRRAMQNLLLNAAQAAPEGLVELVLGEGPDRRQWWFAVRDRGPGFPEEIQAHWGEAYLSTKKEGTGLGLAITRQVVEAHGGRLSAHAREGGGLEVKAVLPRAGAGRKEENP